MADLKPCPFCGGSAEMDTRRGYSQFPSGDPGEAVAVYCHECPADISLCREDMPDLSIEDMAALVIERWNLRTAAKEP